MGGWNRKGTVDLAGVERLTELMQRYGDEAQVIITKYLAEDSLDTIGPAISRLLPVSGRTFPGHSHGAKAAGYSATFMATAATVGSVLIRSRPAYNYLYFPDDGTNTDHHAGKQRFMVRGAQAAVPQVANDICSRLAAKFEEG